MKKKLVRIFALGLLSATTILLMGCSGPPKLGPKPKSYGSVMEGWQSQAIDDFRAWLEKLDAKSSAALSNTGEVRFPFAELQSNDPTHAELVARYVDAIDARKRADTGLIFRTTPQAVVFRRLKDVASGKFIRGEYMVDIELTGGGVSSLRLSDPTGTPNQ